MGREAQKKRVQEGAPETLAEDQAAVDAERGAEEQPQIDPVALAMQSMIAFEDQRYIVQKVAVGKKDERGMRELTFPVSPVKQITFVLAAELSEHILKEFSAGIEVADLSDIAAVKAAAEAEAEQKS